MPTHLLLDGDDLPALMVRVKEEMGPDARIVRAERIRTGGIAGFFARERYELVVEVPEPGPRARRPLAGLGALLEAADAEEQAANGEEPSPAPVSTAGDSFAAVLASMRQMVGTEPEGEPDARPADLTGAGMATAASDAVAADGPERTASADAAEAVPAGAVPAEAVPTLAVEGAAPLAPPDVEAPTHRPEAPTPAEGGASAAGLLELGVPVRLLSGFPSLTDPVPLSVLVRRFDRPPGVRLDAGAMVAVVGPADAALRTAGQMAQRAGMDPHEVLLAGQMPSVAGHGRRVLTVAAAARCRARLRDDAPTIVALGCGDTRAAWADAAALLEALDPDQAWGVLDARDRTVTMRRWIRAIGARRPLDALATFATFEAQSPGTVLDLGTPIGWVDGLPASPVVWAALLSERLADDAQWD